MELILSAILGGLLVLMAAKFTPKKSILKLLLKMFLVVKDYFLAVAAEGLEKFKDLLAESKAEYDNEKTAEKEIHMD
jgi:hypothetical protein